MLRLLRQISLRQLRASWGRSSLVVGGIATGVSLIVAIQIINTSVLTNFRQTLETIAGPAALQVTLGVGEIGFPEDVLEVVRADRDVVAAVPLVMGTVALASDPADTLQLFGADLTSEEDLERYQVKLTTDRRGILSSLNDPKWIALTASYAGPRNLRLGERLRLSTPQGIQDLTLRGLLEAEGLGQVFGGRMALMDLPAAQLLLSKEGRLDQIDLLLRPEADVETMQGRLAAVLPAQLTVSRPAQRAALYDNTLRSFQWMLTGLSLLCLVAGVYIIYNTASTGAVHRALVIAGLKSIGADAGQLFRLLMLEALVLGLMGAGIGIPIGIALARLLTGMVAESMGVIFQLRFAIERLAIPLPQLLLIGGLGVAAALFASRFAARRVTALDPLQVMRADPSSLGARVSPQRLVLWWLALVLVASAALLLEVRFKSIAWGNFGSTLWFASSVVIAIPLVTSLGAILSRSLRRLAPAEGSVAAESLLRSPMRTGVTVAAVTLILTVAITLRSMAVSHRESVRSYFIEGFLSSDLAVTAVVTEGGWLESPLPGELVAELRSIPGIRTVEAIRIFPGHLYRGQRIAIAGATDGLFDPERYPAWWYRAGDPAQAAEALRAGQGANVSASFADRFGVQLGDRIELDAPTGKVSLRVVGVVPDYISDRGAVAVSSRLLADRWQDASVNRIHVFVDTGVPTETVRRLILERLSSRHRLKVLTMSEGVAYLADKIDRAYAFTYAIQLLIVVVTVAGVFDLLLASIWERRRELALWRVIGAAEGTIRRSVVLESATIGMLGSVLAVPVGLVTAWTWVGINYRYLLGYYVDVHFAFGTALWCILLALVMTVVAGYLAARHATRQPVLEGIQVQ